MAHIARKRFGQNFLVDPSIVAAIVTAIAPQRGERIVEIGPGLGALTAPLLEHVDKLYAIELDRHLIERLRRHFGEKLRLHEGDALTYDFTALAEPALGQPSLRIVGNLPYNISSPLLFHLLQASEVVIDQHFMLQNEVVERMTAQPGTKAYGRLSVMLQTRYWMEKLLDVPPHAFKPVPKVDSALVRMMPLRAGERSEVDWAVLSELVMTAFSQRRKMLRNTLAGYRDRVDFTALGFDLARRAEEVPVDEYVRLAQRVANGDEGIH